MDINYDWEIIPKRCKLSNYYVSRLGFLWSKLKRKVMNGYSGEDDYFKVAVYYDNSKIRSQVPLHKIMADIYLKNPENKLTVDHIDRNPANNNIINLRWATHSEQCDNRGFPSKTSNMVRIIQFTANMVKIREWESIAETKQVYRHFGAIGSALKNGTLIYGSYWKYEEPLDLPGEIWITIPEFENCDPTYKASSEGRFMKKFSYRKKISTGSLHHNGYKIVEIHKIPYKLHRIICRMFHGDPPDESYIANHIDGNKTNNKSSNLEWLTIAQNNQHAHDIGLNKVKKAVNKLSLTGEFIYRYESIKEAALDNNISDFGGITKVCKGITLSSGKFKWEYADFKYEITYVYLGWGISKLKSICRLLGAKGYTKKGITKQELIDLILKYNNGTFNIIHIIQPKESTGIN